MSGTSNEQKLFARILRFKYDPLGFVMYCFPWGKENTALSEYKQPRIWQIEELNRIGENIRNNVDRMNRGLDPKVIYLSIVSGRGIGKSAFINMLNVWFISCWFGGTSTVTATTGDQLRGRTMAELSKWVTMSINSHWFVNDAMKLYPTTWFGDMLKKQLKIDTKYYYVQGQTWSADNPDGFAGFHNSIAMMLIFDEASGIPANIYTISEGFFIDRTPCRIWVTMSNGRRLDGPFYDSHHKEKELWMTRSIDSRTVEGLDQGVNDRIIKRFGIGSDEVRVEVKGEFPLSDVSSFIARELVIDAQNKDVNKLVNNDLEPLVMGIDPAHLGGDSSVVRLRRGRDGTMRAYSFVKVNNMQLASEITQIINRLKPKVVFVDNGYGVGLVDRLVQLGHRNIVGVYAHQKPSGKGDISYENKKAEMWATGENWLRTGGVLDVKDDDLSADLCIPKKIYKSNGKIAVEEKKKIKSRGFKSTDHADAFLLTFAMFVPQTGILAERQKNAIEGRKAYNQFERITKR